MAEMPVGAKAVFPPMDGLSQLRPLSERVMRYGTGAQSWKVAREFTTDMGTFRKGHELEYWAALMPEASPPVGTTYYIDFAAGSNSNNGLASGTAWKCHPYMKTGCGSGLPTYSHTAGDVFCFKGGVTWDATAFPMVMTGAGSGAAGKDFYGACGGFGTGRPIFNMGGAELSPNNRAVVFSNNYIRLSNIEFTGLYWTGAVAWQQDTFIVLGSSTNSEIDNNYFHGWTHATGGGTTDAITVVVGDTHYPNDGVNTTFHDNLIDGADTDLVSGANCVFGGPPIIYDNIIRNSACGVIQNGGQQFYGNQIYNVYRSFQASMHGNAYESNCDDNLQFFNNLLYNTDKTTASSAAAAGVNIIISPISGKTTVAYNNIMYNTPAGNVFGVDGPSACGGASSGGTVYVYNNTVFCGPASAATQPCIGNVTGGVRTFVIKNNLLITTDADGFTAACGASCTASNNLIKTEAQATAGGFTNASSPAYTVTSGSAFTVDVGADVSATCSGCTADYSSVVRPQNSLWDVGATEWTTGGGSTCVVGLSATSLTTWDSGSANQIIGTSSLTPRTVSVTNSGTGSCTITSIADDSDQFTTSHDCPGTLATTLSCTISVLFAPTSLGAKSGTITVNDDDGGSDTVTLSGTGIASPPANPVPGPAVIPPDKEAPKVAVKCPATAKSSLTCDLLSVSDNTGVTGVDVRFGSWVETLLPNQCAIKKRSWSFDVSKMARGVVPFSATARDLAGNVAISSVNVSLY